MDSSKREAYAQLSAALKRGKVPEIDVPGLDASPFDYQKSGILWLYLNPKALLADSTGLGKTIHALALLLLLKSKAKLSPKRRAIVIVPAPSVYGSWKKDGFDRFAPGLKVAIGRGTPKQRQEIYKDKSWEVLLTNYETVRIDIEYLRLLGFKYVVLDEAEVVSNIETQTAKAVRRLTKHSTRVLAMTATPMRSSLMDLYGILWIMCLDKTFGTPQYFRRRHLNFKMVKVYYGGKMHNTKKLVGYKNTQSFKEKLQPFYLRRTYDDVDVPVPSMRSHVVWLEMTKDQKKAYDKLKSQLAAGLSDESSEFEVQAAALKLRQLCVTTQHVDPDTNHSAKFDAFVKKLKGDWSNEQAIVFVKYKDSIKALEQRLAAEGIRFITITGDVSQTKREELRQQFWADPKLQVLIGTTAIERSLNLQCARIQLNLDFMKNPSRHTQFAGRVRRVGSKHKRVYVFFFGIVGTLEEAAYRAAQESQAVADHVFDEESDLYVGLTKRELLKLIKS